MHFGDHGIGQRADSYAALNCTLDDLVINIGDVAHIGHGVTAGTQPALHHIKGHHHARMADVAQVIHRHAADVHTHLARTQGHKCFALPRQRVVQGQTHGLSHEKERCLRGDSGVKWGMFRGLRSSRKAFWHWVLRYNDLSIGPTLGDHNSKAL